MLKCIIYKNWQLINRIIRLRFKWIRNNRN